MLLRILNKTSSIVLQLREYTRVLEVGFAVENGNETRQKHFPETRWKLPVNMNSEYLILFYITFYGNRKFGNKYI